MESQEFLTKYFSGNSSSEEMLEVEKWAEASDENMAEFHHFKQAWSVANEDRFDANSVFSLLSDKIEKKTPVAELPTLEKPNFMKIAAAVLILITSTVLVYSYFTGSLFNGITNTNSETIEENEKDIFLADGSKLFLAQFGKLTYQSDFKKDVQRKVKLEGQAFFDIQKDKSRPFVIETNNAQIEVTGTSFLVNEKQGYTEVSVASGSVKLKKSDGITNIKLTAGETGVVSADNKGLIKRKNRNKNYLSWMTGSFEFKSTPLSEVFALLEEKYHVEIELKNKEIINCKYTSDFEKRSIEDILAIICESLGFKMLKNGNKFILDGEGCSVDRN